MDTTIEEYSFTATPSIENPPIIVKCMELVAPGKSKEYSEFIQRIMTELLLLGDYIREIVEVAEYMDAKEKGETLKEIPQITLSVDFDDFPAEGTPWIFPHTMMAYYRIGETLVFKFKLDKFPACGAIGVSKHVETGEKYRGNGIASRAQIHKARIAEVMGYSAMLCTVMSDNTPQIKTLKKSDWKVVTSFTNIKTGHNVTLFSKDVVPCSMKTFGDLLVEKVKEAVLW